MRMRMKVEAAWEVFKSNYSRWVTDKNYLPEAIVANRDMMSKLPHLERLNCDKIRKCIAIIESLRRNTSISHDLMGFLEQNESFSERASETIPQRLFIMPILLNYSKSNFIPTLFSLIKDLGANSLDGNQVGLQLISLSQGLEKMKAPLHIFDFYYACGELLCFFDSTAEALHWLRQNHHSHLFRSK